MKHKEDVLFSGEYLYDYLNTIKKNIIKEINKENDEYILNIGEESYISFLTKKYKIDNITLHESQVECDPLNEDIPSDKFPYYSRIPSGEKISKVVYYFYLPFTGRTDLLFCKTLTSSGSQPIAAVKNNMIIYRHLQLDEDIEQVNAGYDSFIKRMNNSLKFITDELETFNNLLENYIRNIFLEKKEDIINLMGRNSRLKVPIKKRNNVPSTFSIPTEIKKKIDIKPIQTSSDNLLVPTIDNKAYMDILKIINDMGKEFERKPSVYSNKGEENLRDHFLVLLEPNFEGSATGETFNKSGKTDILLRYQGTNVFVGECKFWSGKSGFLKTIDQLLKYLTWRDSKTAVIIFVKNKDFSSVMKNAKESIQTHPNFIKFNNDSDESWSNYTFHINGDLNKEIKLALMLYHTSS